MEANATTQLSDSGQVAIPEVIRDVLRWQGGMELNISITPSGLLIQSKQPDIKKHRLEELRGFFKYRGMPLSDEQLCTPVDYTEPE